MKVAFIYPGQGAQYAGMGKEIYQKYQEAREIFERADEALGFSISELCFEGPEEELMKTENTQPAILTVSVALTKVLQKRGIKAEVTAGLSLGEYSSLVLAEALDFEDAVRLVKNRGKYMQEVVPQGVGTMAAILGLENEVVEEICRTVSQVGIVEPANYNCPGQLVISGEVKAVEKAVELAKEKGAKRAVVLAVSAPFHCSMLKKAGELLERDLEKIEIKDLKIPVVSNVTADYASKDQVKDLLIKQVSHPVLWEQSVKRMIEDGVDTFVEIGPGKTLTGFVKKIDKTKNAYNFEDEESLLKTLSALGV
ncbi:[acyl-carrier-protein] S-malonyltransferase [Thermoanaerobacter thermohydrosulfuricus]|uniref:Malonyl CoA-acyl carrier protein transacylase n=4 Tax=Thermoanaerobacter TaxID=1754 RepID=B0K9X9_THEP3|nr:MULTISPECIES: ACP S-malonyltransferase [Thermoanaerobacter]ABY94942.1 malonyl CoA-acyl carrier protein transacylase [Thermoanaerobacter pseudethanolicus ATCC 33223]ADV79891.1 malonyl CoA-acyl carrier protein transacylase [Thermoanaerobacter brockii subsp. finnii Ako-1]EMT40359.1 malonyl CoA-acyl carrier protein transacylase [Thermoanaerobacter thermohydrosulfuricus WC1]UZQ81933.1 ACP S-malonyltransferase [Thermoanaerobacter sp. RKWS2]SDG48288.1 [acyl-carrier-protein] S-malonyltransferase [T